MESLFMNAQFVGNRQHPLTVIPAIPNLIGEGIHNQFLICYLGSSKNNNQKTGFPIESGMTPFVCLLAY